MKKPNYRLQALMLGLAGLFWCSQLASQDLRRNQVPGATGSLPTNSVVTPVQAAVSHRDELVNPKLDLGHFKGVVILGAYKDFRFAGVETNGLVLSGPAFLTNHYAAVRKVVSPYFGKALTYGELDRLQIDLIHLCRTLDRWVVDVVYPEQEIKNGVIQIVIYEGKVGKVSVVQLGKGRYSEAFITNHMHLPLRESIKQSEILEDLADLNRNVQFREVSAQYKPGKFDDLEYSGATDIDLNVKDRRPVKFFGGYDDYGLKVLGENRVFAGLDYFGSLLGSDQSFHYQYLTDTSFDRLQAHSASYEASLPVGFFRVFGGYNKIRADLSTIGFPINNNGETYQASARYALPLPHWFGAEQELAAGFDYKDANTAVEFNKIAFAPFRTDIDQLALDYHGYLRDHWGDWHLALSGYYSSGGLLGNNADADFASFQPGLKSSYFYGRFEGGRDLVAPSGWKLHDWELRLSGGYQVASASLLPSEQMYLGGYSILRGYPENVVSGDEGWHASAEIHCPVIPSSLISGSNILHRKNVPGVTPDGDNLDVFGFFDYGSVAPKNPTALQSSNIRLASAGAGLSFRMSENLVVNFSYGFELKDLKPADAPAALAKDKSRAHISATLSF